jgi:hypothetical protein
MQQRTPITPEQLAASHESIRVRRVAQLRTLRNEIDATLKQLGRSWLVDDEQERDLLDAAYAVFECDQLWAEARQYGPKREAL